MVNFDHSESAICAMTASPPLTLEQCWRAPDHVFRTHKGIRNAKESVPHLTSAVQFSEASYQTIVMISRVLGRDGDAPIVRHWSFRALIQSREEPFSILVGYP